MAGAEVAPRPGIVRLAMPSYFLGGLPLLPTFAWT